MKISHLIYQLAKQQLSHGDIDVQLDTPIEGEPVFIALSIHDGKVWLTQMQIVEREDVDS